MPSEVVSGSATVPLSNTLNSAPTELARQPTLGGSTRLKFCAAMLFCEIRTTPRVPLQPFESKLPSPSSISALPAVTLRSPVAGLRMAVRLFDEFGVLVKLKPVASSPVKNVSCHWELPR